MKRIIVSFLGLVTFCVLTQAQFRVEEPFQDNMTCLDGTDPSNPTDANGKATAVVKVTSNVPNLLFESDYIIGKVENRNGVYKFHMAHGARFFRIKMSDGSAMPLEVKFLEHYCCTNCPYFTIIKEKGKTDCPQCFQCPKCSSSMKSIKKLESKHCYKMQVTADNFKCLGKLNIKYGPQDAELYVDGKLYRGSDYSELLGCGNHTIKVQKNEYETQTFEVYIEQGETVERHIELQQTSAKLRITTDDKCKIYLDGNYLAEHKYDGKVKIGTHKVKVVYGAHSKSQTIDVGKSGENITLNLLGLLREDYSKSNTSFESNYDKIKPIKGNDMPERTIQSKTTTSVLGDYKVYFNRPGYWTRTKKVCVEPLKTTTVYAPKLYKRKPWTFLSYQYSPKANTGLMLGICGKVGGYISGRYNVGKPLFSGNFSPAASESPFGINSWSANGGLMFRFCQEMYMYVGAGYGSYESDGSKFAAYSLSGANVEGGFIFNIHGPSGKGFTLSVGYNTFVNKDYLKAYSTKDALSNLSVGIGFAL